MRKLILLASALLLVSQAAFASSIQSLNKSQVTSALLGKTITTIPLVTINGQLVGNSFTGFFDKGGNLQGQFSTKPDNDPQTDQGKWAVQSDGSLCATWQHWNQSKPICVIVYQLTNGFLFVNKNNKNIETMVLDQNIKTGNQLGQ